MKMRSFFSYLGSKRQLASHYPRPKYQTIIEPFAGSACYSVHYYHHNIQLYDLNPKIIGIWNYLIKVSPEEIMRLPAVVMDVREEKICEEAKWLIGHWLRKASSIPGNMPTKGWTHSVTGVGSPGSIWSQSIKERLARQVPLIRHWKATVRSYKNVPDHRATWFIDPPYQVHGKRYVFHDIDYAHLASWIKGRWGQVIVCGEPTDDYLPFRILRRTASLSNTLTGKDTKFSDEMIYTCHNE